MNWGSYFSNVWKISKDISKLLLWMLAGLILWVILNLIFSVILEVPDSISTVISLALLFVIFILYLAYQEEK